MLSRLATSTAHEVVDDCYFLVDDQGWNAKVRENTLKLKQLVAEERGFERWSSNSYRSADATPSPFDALFEDLDLQRAAKGESFDLAEAVSLLGADPSAKAVFVTKHRIRYRIGPLRAEVTDITLAETGEVLHTLAIEGDDLDDLAALRKKLGLKSSENVAVHVAIDG